MAAFLESRGISQRRACWLLGLSRRWRNYQGLGEEVHMIDTLKELARRYPRFGYRRLHQMLLRERPKNPPANVKRVRRLCVLSGLSLPRRRTRKRRGQGMKPPVIAEFPNHVWAYDFVFDWSENGRQLKFLTLVDEYTRQGLAIEVDHRMNARQVWQVLDRVMAQQGAPLYIRSDNGPEFVARHLMRMLAARGITCRHIEPGSPWQNGRNERFNGTFRDECANMETFHHRDHARAIAKLFLRYYNQERPHSALSYQTPGEFARRHPPSGAGYVVAGSNVPSPAPDGGCRNGPAGRSLPHDTSYSV